MGNNGRILKAAIAVFGISLAPVGSAVVQAQSSGDRPLVPLTGIPPGPSLTDYYAIVQSPTVLVALGKALFWDTQVGKANGQACASCHFHAGADPRTVNQLSPGLKVQPVSDTTFGGTLVGASGTRTGVMGNGAVAGPNVQLVRADYPFHKLADVTDRESAVLFDTNDVTSSQGAFQGTSTAVPGNLDRCGSTPGAPFASSAGGTSLNTRKVEPRNTPTAINAAFNNRNFWDGRANNVFNGVNPFGRRGIAANPAARVYVASGTSVLPKILALENMSAASQAVGPVLSNFEMTCDGKTFPDLGRSMLSERALQNQQVAADDSVFSRMPGGSIILSSGGLKSDYRTLIQQAFKPAYWNNAQYFTVDPPTGNVTLSTVPTVGYRVDELNFSMFFGIAVDAYERTLISDKTPFDVGTMSDDARHGQDIFTGKAKCATCHDGALFTKAAAVQGESPFNPIVHMPMDNDPAAFADSGFFNTGVRPAFEDVGLGGSDAFGNQLSFTRQMLGAKAVDHFQVNPCGFEVAFDPANCNRLPSAAEAALQRVAVDGAFKTPGLRNVALTAPYMHNGGQRSLEDVVDFYSRGGDRRLLSNPGSNPGVTKVVADLSGGRGGGGSDGTGAEPASGLTGDDTTGTGLLGQSKPIGAKMGGSNAHPEIKPFSLNPTQKMQMVEFLKSLTDPRVACHAAPFDHPSLTVANGQSSVSTSGSGNADDKTMTISAVGAAGYSTCKANYQALNSGDLFTSSAAFSRLK